MHTWTLYQPRSCQSAISVCAARRRAHRTAGGVVAQAKKQASDADLMALVKQLRAENSALRVQLARAGLLPSGGKRAQDASAPAPPSPQARALASPRRKREDPDPHQSKGQSLPSLAELEAGIVWPQGREDRFWERPPRKAPLSLPGPPGKEGPPATAAEPLTIIHIAAEMAPIAKVGGLADVVTGLSKATAARGHSVEVVLPYYAFLEGSPDVRDARSVGVFNVPKGNGLARCEAFSATVEGCRVLLLRPVDQGSLFQGQSVYGGAYNETEAYLHFSRSALEAVRVLERRPDVLHCHEWQTGAVPMLFWEAYSATLPRTRLVLTIHNFDSVGECRQDEFLHTGMAGGAFASVDRALDERTVGHNPERLCLLKGGIVYANAVTTVSPNYAREAVRDGAAGFLKSTLAQPHIAAKFTGIINGIDTESWDPARDATLPAPFSGASPRGKALCKRFLQAGLGMSVAPDKPLVAVVSRLVPQKGIHLMEAALHHIVQHGGQFVLLGSGHADGALRRAAEEQYRDNADVQCLFMYSEPLSHLIYAAADMFLVPSLFEPCGLTQLIALRYGAIPIVRATGGLADTVKDVASGDGGNGYVFQGMDGGAVQAAVGRAMADYRERPGEWQGLVLRVLDDGDAWSWDGPTEEYLDIYSKVLA
ncbi:SSS4 [Auxenochlorella protothecoides x Auxenochlorella symbiontica]